MAEQKIEEGMLVKVGGGVVIPITTIDSRGRIYDREKKTAVWQFFFGIVKEVTKNGIALVNWAGPRCRFSALPVEKLIPAVNQAKR